MPGSIEVHREWPDHSDMLRQQSAEHWAHVLAEVEAEITKLQALADFIRQRVAENMRVA